MFRVILSSAAARSMHRNCMPFEKSRDENDYGKRGEYRVLYVPGDGYSSPISCHRNQRLKPLPATSRHVSNGVAYAIKVRPK